MPEVVNFEVISSHMRSNLQRLLDIQELRRYIQCFVPKLMEVLLGLLGSFKVTFQRFIDVHLIVGARKFDDNDPLKFLNS